MACTPIVLRGQFFKPIIYNVKLVYLTLAEKACFYNNFEKSKTSTASALRASDTDVFQCLLAKGALHIMAKDDLRSTQEK